jgi:nitronate monooxygenase
MTLQELLGIELPIIQAPMAGAQGSELAIAVSNAGGLGSLPCAMLSLEAMQSELEAIQSRTRKPFNVNFFCHAAPEVNAAREAGWRKLLQPYLSEFGIVLSDAPTAALRAPFSAAAADVLEPFKPAVVSFHFGLPAPDLLKRVKSWGSTVLASATTVAEALWLSRCGADAIIAQGLEAGGIADANGVAAALSMGAAGVQPGTAYLLCPEASTSAVHRAALQSDRAAHTALTNLFSGRPARGIVNRLMADLGPLNSAAPAFPLAAGALAALRKKAEGLGNGDFSPLWAGQNVSGCREIPAAALTHSLMGS